MNYLWIYGTGRTAQNYLRYIESELNGTSFQVAGFINGTVDKKNNLLGYKVVEMEDAELESEDRILIAVADYNYDTVFNRLVENYQIPRRMIIDILCLHGWLHGIYNFKSEVGKIYDTFIFFNEYEILDIRLKCLYEYVDFFVICEMNTDFKGRQKPYNFEQNKERYKKYIDKIIYIKVEGDKAIIDQNDVWGFEIYQRNSIMKGLKNAEENDLVIISDCDEIVNPDLLKQFRNKEQPRNADYMYCFLENNGLVMEQDFHYYYFNLRHKVKWYGSVLVKKKNLYEPQIFRINVTRMPYVKNGGWHLSYFGTPEKVALKTRSIVDGISVERDAVEAKMKQGDDIYSRSGKEHTMEWLTDQEITFPDYKQVSMTYPMFVGKAD